MDKEQLMLKTADLFSETARMIEERALSEENLLLNIPYGVNAGLAVELYLKCLVSIECGQVPRTHNLKNLFCQLRRETRKKLEQKHDQIADQDQSFGVLRQHGVATDLLSLLENGHEAFEWFRYPYETDFHNKPASFALTLLGACVRDFIIDLRPKWLSENQRE
jgi:hypothetical protein